MRERLKLEGQRFGRLIVIKPIGKKGSGNKGIYWLCRCDCGNMKKVRGDSLTRGRTKSCGCLVKERMRLGMARTHGDSPVNGKISPYKNWNSMKNRCHNPSAEAYHRYGGRGITVCPEWRDDYLSFKQWALANGFKLGLTIDKINNDGDYEPSNCQWLTRSENAKKSNSR